MAKPQCIFLGRDVEIPILYEDRAVLVIDKPAGWMLAPTDWDRTSRNLQLAITSSIRVGDFWARSRNLKFLRFVHRLDAETTGLLLFAKSAGAVSTYSRLFESRQVRKTYFAVTTGTPGERQWVCRARLAPDPHHPGRMRLDEKHGKDAETYFAVESQSGLFTLLRVLPATGRTHQIRLHAVHSGLSIVGDPLYGASQKSPSKTFPLALRATELQYSDPFTRKKVLITAPMHDFAAAFAFTAETSKR